MSVHPSTQLLALVVCWGPGPHLCGHSHAVLGSGCSPGVELSVMAMQQPCTPAPVRGGKGWHPA